jgi:hypothetical protein
VKALAQQLGAEVETLAGPAGTSVSIAHATLWTKETGPLGDARRRQLSRSPSSLHKKSKITLSQVGL